MKPNAPFSKLGVSGDATFEGAISFHGIKLTYDSTNKAIKIDGNLYATGGITAYGAGASTTGGGGGLNGSVKSYSNALKLTSESLSEIASAYSIKALDSRISSLEGGSAMNVSVSGSGNAVTAISKSGTTIIVTKGTTFLTSHQSLASYLTRTDAAILYQPKGNYLTAHQSLDGYVNEVATSGTGNAITSVSKSGKKLTFTKGATFLTSHQSLANYVTINDSRLSDSRYPKFANGTWYLVGDDAYIGDHNLSGYFCVKSANDSTRVGISLWNRAENDYANLWFDNTNINLDKQLVMNNKRIWIQGVGTAGGNNNRLTLVAGMPSGLAYNTSCRGTILYSNGIAFADPYNGNSNNDSGWIRHLETSANSGTLEIAVGDDASNEQIHFRWYNTNSSAETIAHDITVPRATGTLALTSQIPTTLPANGGNADTVDGIHANGLLTALSNSDKGISITVGGTTKSISNISVNYAGSAGNADTVDGLHSNSFAPYNGAKFGHSPDSNIWHQVLQFTTNWVGQVTFIYSPEECQRDYWGIFNINIRSNDIWFHGFNLANIPEMKCVGDDANNWSVWVKGNANAYDPYGTIQVLNFTNASIKSVGITKSQVNAPSGNYVKSPTILSAGKVHNVTLWGQSFDGTDNVSGSLSGVGHIQFSADNSYSIGTTTSEAAHTYTRQVWARHLNASRVYAGDTNLYIGYSNTAQVRFFSGTKQSGDGSNERMTISTNGNVGIGTAVPAYKLHVVGDIYSSDRVIANNSVLSNKLYSSTTPNINTPNKCIEIAGNTIREYHLETNSSPFHSAITLGDLSLRLSAYSSIGISAMGEITLSSTQEFTIKYRDAKFTVEQNGSGYIWSMDSIKANGNILATGGITAYSSSDIRLKQDLRKLDYLGIIKAMGGTYGFAWKKDNTRSIGWIAQHVLCNPHLKDIVETDEKGYYKINYWSPKLIATAFGAIEQVGDEVSRLKARVVFLESEVQRLSGDKDGNNKKRLDNKNINSLN